MTITADDLKQEIANLEQQMREAANVYQQARGALMLAQAMLQRFGDDDDAIPLEAFAEAVGGNGATAVIEELEEDG